MVKGLYKALSLITGGSSPVTRGTKYKDFYTCNEGTNPVMVGGDLLLVSYSHLRLSLTFPCRRGSFSHYVGSFDMLIVTSPPDPMRLNRKADMFPPTVPGERFITHQSRGRSIPPTPEGSSNVKIVSHGAS